MKRKDVPLSFRPETRRGIRNSYSRSEVEVQLFFLDVGEQRERHRLRPENRGGEFDDALERDGANVADDVFERDGAAEVDLVLGDMAHPRIRALQSQNHVAHELALGALDLVCADLAGG